MTVGGLGQHHAGEQPAEGERQAGQFRRQREDQGQQQGGAHHQLVEAQSRHPAVEPLHRPPGEGEHHGDQQPAGEERLQDAGECPAIFALRSRQHQERHQHGTDGEVLQDQHGEGGAAVTGGELAAIGQEPQHHRGGGERQRHGQHQTLAPRPAQRHGDGEDRGHGEADLQDADHQRAQADAAHARERQLQADGEEQEDDAEFREGMDQRRDGEEVEERRAHQHTRQQISQHRPAAEAHRSAGTDEAGEQHEAEGGEVVGEMQVPALPDGPPLHVEGETLR
ncbi:hypothetical protein HRbin39_00791 [bacterium HR39]|nr:hypothetical protein HRbin39_00791 [bacterium HR39]